MTMKWQMTGVLSLTLILVLFAGAASAAPVIPQQYYGHVTINGVPATDGTLIVASIGGTDRGSITTTGGMYGGPGAFDPKLLVSADDSEVGAVITFTVNGHVASENSTVVAGGGSVQELDLTVAIPNPIPAIAALYPPNTPAGSGQLTLSVLGLNFVQGCTVKWNGEDRATSYTSANQVTAIIPAADLANTGTASVTVVNPSPGGGISNAVTFLITQPQNPVPHIDTLDPASCVEGSDGFTMTVHGSNFIASSTVHWNGVEKMTSYVSSNEVSAYISSADVVKKGNQAVTVVNPAPGGGTSNTVLFNVSAFVSPLAVVPAGGDVFIGEQGLDITGAVPSPYTQVVWYEPGHDPLKDAPDGGPYTIASKTDFYVDQATFLQKQGNWYLWAGSPTGVVAFVVKEPQISLKIYDPNGPVKDAKTVGIPIRFIGTDIDFLIETNLYTLATQRSFTTGFIQINIGSPNGVNYTALRTVNNGDRNLRNLVVPNSYFRWSATQVSPSTPVAENFWETAAKKPDNTLLYAGGVYTIWVNSTANRMNFNYNVEGKTTSTPEQVNIVAEGVSVTPNPSSMTRANQSFTATVIGRPNTDYYLWIKECPLKRTGVCCDQPPMIKDNNQAGVVFDPPGSTVIGSRVMSPACCVNGTRIIDTVPKNPASGSGWATDMWHRYYAKVTTDNDGKRNVEFEVNDCTAPGTYTLHVEGTDVNGKTIWAEAPVTINLGQVTITMNQTAYLGERIKISGTNTDTSKTYLFLRGPCLQLCGVNLRDKKPVVNNNPSTFVVANVTDYDITWALDQDPAVNPNEAVWDTSKLGIDAGEYTVYAVSKPNDYCTLTGSCPNCVCAAWAAQNITLLKPGLTANLTPEWIKTVCTAAASYCDPKTLICGDPCAPTILLSGTATGLIPRDADPGVTLNGVYNRDKDQKQLGLWIFGRTTKIGSVHYIHDYVNVSCDGTFSVDLAKIIAKSTPLQQIQPGTYDVILVHPMYNHEFDVVHEDEAVDPLPPREPNIKYVISTCPTPWSKEFVIEGPGAKWESEGRDALITALNRTCVDDEYLWLNFTVRDSNAPIANFQADPTEGLVPLEVLFTDYSLGDPMTFHWDFGDGVTYDTQFPNRNPPPHTYTAVGNYSPSLTVTNAKGISDTIVKKDLIHVYAYPPEPLVADFSGTPRNGSAPLSVQFSDLTSDGPVLWLWNFGDGGTSNIQHPQHTYTSPGNFTVSLVVWNATGAVSTAVKNDYIQVTGQPVTTTVTPTPYDKIILNPNWNFVSVPKVLAEGNNTGTIFSDVDRAGHSIWYYDGFQKLWVRIDSTTIIRPLEGIWIFSQTPKEVPLKFNTDPIMLPPTKKLAQGWNTIGFTGFIPATARDTFLSVKSNWTQAIGFDASAQVYESSIINGGSGEHSDQRVLYPTKGYWIYMNSPAEITAIGV